MATTTATTTTSSLLLLSPTRLSPRKLLRAAGEIQSVAQSRQALHLATRAGRTLTSALAWDDPAAALALCTAWVALCAAAQPLVVLGPHLAALSVLVANHPAVQAHIAAAAAANPVAATPTRHRFRHVRTVARAASQVQSLVATPRAVVTWRDRDTAAQTTAFLLATFPVWIALNLLLPLNHAVAVAGLVPLCWRAPRRIADGVMRGLDFVVPPLAVSQSKKSAAVMAGEATPGRWLPLPSDPAPVDPVRAWLELGWTEHLVQVQRWVPFLGYIPLSPREEAALVEALVAAGCEGDVDAWRWSARHARGLPSLTSLEAEGGDAARAFVRGVCERMGVNKVEDVSESQIAWAWEEETEGGPWTPSTEWQRADRAIAVGAAGATRWWMPWAGGSVRYRRMVRHAMCRVHAPVLVEVVE
ncbi:hypothetical protein H9P43_001910 [Blastocladiella emersonii ATCC 22665]|nr:hypothetical protein H9P43_001910 [Blastocladiella emersonii ATCC 22665]